MLWLWFLSTVPARFYLATIGKVEHHLKQDYPTPLWPLLQLCQSQFTSTHTPRTTGDTVNSHSIIYKEPIKTSHGCKSIHLIRMGRIVYIFCAHDAGIHGPYLMLGNEELKGVFVGPQKRHFLAENVLWTVIISKNNFGNLFCCWGSFSVRATIAAGGI